MEHYTKSLPYELELTSRVLHEAARCFFEQNNFPVSQDEFSILDCLYIYPDIIQIELAKLIFKGRAHTGRFLKSMEEKGLIARCPGKSGTKIIMKNKITPKGLELYNRINKALDEHIEAANSEINVDIKTTIKMLQTIRTNAIKRFNIKFE